MSTTFGVTTTTSYVLGRGDDHWPSKPLTRALKLFMEHFITPLSLAVGMRPQESVFFYIR
jgi:hypothetical protein